MSTHRFRLDILTNLLEDAPSGNQFFLKHPDDKGDTFDIVGIIDWEWTYAVSKAEAFCSPCIIWPVAKFYSGSNELAEDELRLAAIFNKRGRKDLTNYIINGRKI